MKMRTGIDSTRSDQRQWPPMKCEYITIYLELFYFGGLVSCGCLRELHPELNV